MEITKDIAEAICYEFFSTYQNNYVYMKNKILGQNNKIDQSINDLLITIIK